MLHPASTAIVVPFAQYLGNLACFFTPYESIRASRLFLKPGWLIELGLYGFADEPKWFVIHISTSSLPSFYMVSRRGSTKKEKASG